MDPVESALQILNLDLSRASNEHKILFAILVGGHEPLQAS